MKQHITVDQLSKLSKKGKNRLRKWWEPWMGDLFTITSNAIWITKQVSFKEEEFIFHGVNFEKNKTWLKTPKIDCLPLLAIGQMMEFLGDINLNWLFDGTTIVTETLCDALWEAVKEILER